MCGSMSDVNDYDFYRSTTDASLRMAVPRLAGLPPHVDPKDWIIMYATTMRRLCWSKSWRT